MPSVKSVPFELIHSKVNSVYFFWSLIFVLLLSVQLVNSGITYIQPTTDIWISRSLAFILNFLKGDFSGTYQQYHPGVSLMWLVGIGSGIFAKIISPGTNPSSFLSPEVFPVYYFWALLPVLLVQSFLETIILFLLRKIIDLKWALLFGVLLATEPFFLGNARSIHLDTLVTLTLFITALCWYQVLTKSGKIYPWLTGIFFGLGLATKITTLYLAPFMLLTYLPLRKSLKFRNVIYIWLIASVTFYLFFPAMWKTPVEVALKVFNEGIFETGITEVSRPFLLLDLPPSIISILAFPLTILWRLSAIATLGLIVFLVGITKSKHNLNLDFLKYISLYFFGYLIMMTIPSKKIYRYALPLLPVIILFSTYGILILTNLLKRVINPQIIITSVVLMSLMNVIWNGPNFMATFNPLIGGISQAGKVIDLNEDATNYFEVATYLNSLNIPGDSTIASYDWLILGLLTQTETVSIRRSEKPLGSTYSLISSSRGQEYLGNNFEQIKTFYIHGYPYWQLYRRIK